LPNRVNGRASRGDEHDAASADQMGVVQERRVEHAQKPRTSRDLTLIGFTSAAHDCPIPCFVPSAPWRL